MHTYEKAAQRRTGQDNQIKLSVLFDIVIFAAAWCPQLVFIADVCRFCNRYHIRIAFDNKKK